MCKGPKFESEPLYRGYYLKGASGTLQGLILPNYIKYYKLVISKIRSNNMDVPNQKFVNDIYVA